MRDQKNDDYLAQEYLAVQRFTEDFDGRALTIKAWSVTFSAAGLGLAYTQNRPLVLLIAAGGAVIFWIVEAIWKVNQQAYYPRIHEIERHFAGEAETKPFQIAASWSRAYHGRHGYRDALRIMRWPHVAMPHLLVAIAGLAFYLLLPPR